MDKWHWENDCRILRVNETGQVALEFWSKYADEDGVDILPEAHALIQSAPDLLKVARQMYDHIYGVSEEPIDRDKIWAVIDKAEGGKE